MPVIDRSLNYGRSAIAEFVSMATPVASALDVGAGAGLDLDTVRSICPDARLFGIEGFIEFTRMLEKKSIETINIDIESERFPFEDESLDLVLSNQVFEHLKEIYWTLDNVARTLKTGGHFILGVPNLASLHNRLLLSVGRQPTSIGNHSAHIRGYTRQDILRLLDAGFPGGFELRGFRGGNFYPLPPTLAKPLAYLLPNMAVSIFLLFRKSRPYEGSFLRYPVDARLNTHFFVGGEDELWSFDDNQPGEA